MRAFTSRIVAAAAVIALAAGAATAQTGGGSTASQPFPDVFSQDPGARDWPPNVFDRPASPPSAPPGYGRDLPEEGPVTWQPGEPGQAPGAEPAMPGGWDHGGGGADGFPNPGGDVRTLPAPAPAPGDFRSMTDCQRIPIFFPELSGDPRWQVYAENFC